MAVWNPGDTPQPPISFITTARRLPEGIQWRSDKYVDVEPRGCTPAHGGGHPCAKPTEDPPPDEELPPVRWTVGCEACGEPMCFDKVPETKRFEPFTVHSKVCGCAGSDTTRLAQVRAALDLGMSSQLAANYFRLLDECLDPALNVTPGGPNCAREVLRAVLQARGSLGLSTGALAMDIGTAFALIEEGLGTFQANGIQVAGLPVATDYAMPAGGGTNLTGEGGGWLVGLPSLPAFDTSDHLFPNPSEGSEIPQQYWDRETGCYEPSAKKWAIVAFDPGCITWGEVVTSCCPCCGEGEAEPVLQVETGAEIGEPFEGGPGDPIPREVG